MPDCSVRDCYRRCKARGMCATHYEYWRRRNLDNGPTQGVAGFWRHVLKTETCWLWQGNLDGKGYGRYGRVFAHRFAYELLVGPIPDGLTLDHLCRVRSCVNPAHAEPTTRGVNSLRGYGPPAVNARKTECPQGHAYSPENTRVVRGRRNCRECGRDYNRRWRARLRLVAG